AHLAMAVLTCLRSTTDTPFRASPSPPFTPPSCLYPQFKPPCHRLARHFKQSPRCAMILQRQPVSYSSQGASLGYRTRCRKKFSQSTKNPPQPHFPSSFNTSHDSPKNPAVAIPPAVLDDTGTPTSIT